MMRNLFLAAFLISCLSFAADLDPSSSGRKDVGLLGVDSSFENTNPIDSGFGNPAYGLRNACVLGNASDEIEYGMGAASAQTIRTATASDSPDVTSLESLDAKVPMGLTLDGDKLKVTTGAGPNPNGYILNAEPKLVHHAEFDDDLQTDLFAQANVGTGETTHASSGQAVTATGTTAGSSALFYTKVPLDYYSSIASFSQFSLAVPQPPTAANSFVAAGLHNFPSSPFNGFAVGYSSTQFGIFHLNNSAVEFIPQSSFNEDPLDGSASSKFLDDSGDPVAIDPTKGNVYRIVFLWHGYGPAFFQVVDRKGSWITFHKFAWVNENVIPHMSKADIPFTIYVNNGATTTNVTAYIGSVGMGRYGSVEEDHDQGSITANTLRVVKANPSGALSAYTGTATTTAVNVPSTAGNVIGEALVENKGLLQTLQASFDGGTTYANVPPGASLTVDPMRGEMTQIKIKSASGTTAYEILLGTQ